MRPRIVRHLALSLLAALVIGAGDRPAAAVDLTDARLLALERKLFDASIDARSAPRNADVALDAVARELHWLKLEAPRNSQVGRLARRAQELRWQAQAPDQRPLGRVPARLPVPDCLRTPSGTDLRREELPIGVGKQFILLQRRLLEAAHRLARGEASNAASLLSDAERRFSALRAEPATRVPSDDPNLVAAERQLSALKQRLRQVRREG